jgi:hypothetical protein
VRARLGAGAFGAVYRAYDPQLEREVALKVPHPGSLESPTAVERFLREAKAAARLRHPHIVPVYEAGSDHAHHYIATAFIDGCTLARAVEERRLDFRRAAEAVRDLAGALAYAHAEGVVHRDVKPANVMLDRRGAAYLMDFGLAHRQDAEQLTQQGSVLGTPAYMAPEQAAGQTGRPLPASDQYSLGVILYELLCGRVPFSGPPQIVLFNILHQTAPAPRAVAPGVPAGLERVCRRAMARRPEDRYPGCQELADDLTRWLQGEPPQAPEGQGARWPLLLPALLAGAAVALLGLVVLAVAVWRWSARPPAVADDPPAPAPAPVLAAGPPPEAGGAPNTPPPENNLPPPPAGNEGAKPDAFREPPPPQPARPKRGRPEVLGIDEAQAAVVHAKVRAFLLEDGAGDTYAFALVGAPEKKNEAAALAQVFRRRGPSPAAAPPSTMGRPGAGRAGPGGPGMPGMMKKPGEGGRAADLATLRRGMAGFGKRGYPLKAIAVADLDKNPNVHLAEEVLPTRMAVIAASFPYRKQLHEFRAKLGLDSTAAVLNELSAKGQGADGRPLPAFRFLGVRVQRREVGPDGKPRGEYQDIDLNKEYTPYLVRTGMRFEPEAPQYAPVIFPGLVMPRLKCFRVDEAPPYPEVEDRLSGLQTAIRELERQRRAGKDTPPAGRDLDAFNPGGAAKDGKAKPAPEDETLPERCLVRVVDVTVRPGKAYQYRLQVRLANPNHGRVDVAAAADAAGAELTAGGWFVVPGVVAMPPEVHYYAVDEVKWGGAPPPIQRDRQTYLQIHRWLETFTQVGARVTVGEWVVAEGVIANRGEYVKFPLHAEFPYWDTTLAEFVLATWPYRARPGRFGFGPEWADGRDTLLVDCRGGAVESYARRPLAGAGEGAKPQNVLDGWAQEVLLLTPDGKLLALSGADDAADEQRTKRLNEVRARIRRVDAAARDQLQKERERIREERKMKNPGPGLNPFGPGGPNGQ